MLIHGKTILRNYLVRIRDGFQATTGLLRSLLRVHLGRTVVFLFRAREVFGLVAPDASGCLGPIVLGLFRVVGSRIGLSGSDMAT